MKRSTKFLLFGIGLGLGLYGREIFNRSKGITQASGPRVMGWLSRDATTEELIAELEAAGKRSMQQIMEKLPTERNYKLLNHVIGIERWGQQRLRVGLGAPFQLDEYDRYRPPFGISWNELQDLFQQTRQETLALATRLAEQGLAEKTVLHNDFGELTINHWLCYLRIHARNELWKMNG